MSARQHTDDDSTEYETEYETVTLAEADMRSSPAQGDAFQRIEAALAEADDSYSAEVTYEFTCKDTSVVVITSSDHYWNEGEVGTERFRVTIGSHGGLNKATKENEITRTERDYVSEASTKRRAWSRLLRNIERAA